MKFPWFKRTGVLMVPVSIVGWTILLVLLAYAVYIFRDIDSRSHSVSDTLINFAFRLVIFGMIYYLTAFFTSKK
jgi:hypothetical protein